MILYAIFSIAAAASLITALVIVVRKFPHLSLIDTKSLPKERDAQRKKEIIKERVGRMAAGKWSDFVLRVSPFLSELQDRFRATYARAIALERQYQTRLLVSQSDRQAKIVELSREADERLARGDAAGAERKLIDIISFDPRNAEAYRRLGSIYLDGKQYSQARETFVFLVKLDLRNAASLVRAVRGSVSNEALLAALRTDMARDYLNLGLAETALGNNIEAKRAFEQAAAAEPANPKYLDLLLETCILVGDKLRAGEVLEQLRSANPDNQKLGAFFERISVLADPPSRQKKTRK